MLDFNSGFGLTYVGDNTNYTDSTKTIFSEKGKLN